MRISRWAVAAAAAAGTFLAAAPAANAAVGCAYNSATALVTVTMTNYGSATLARTAGGAITVNGNPCGAATATNTNSIRIVGDANNQTVDIDLTNPLGPGKTGEGTVAASEMEVNAILGNGYDTVRLAGSAAVNTWTLGSAGANLNNDGDGDDLRWSGLDQIELKSLAGNDVLSLAGSATTGSPLNKRAYIFAGQGADRATGGYSTDYIYADADQEYVTPVTGGADIVSGGASSDHVNAGAGNDIVNGQDGGDYLCGGAGTDTLNGNAGDDSFEPSFLVQCDPDAPDGADTYNGGSGARDTVNYYERAQNIRVTLDNVANDGADTNSPPDGTANELDNVKADVENVEGGTGNDFFDATSAPATAADLANSFRGNDGNDTLKGGANRDFLEGQNGNDTIDGGDESDTVFAGNDLDTVVGGAGDDFLDSGAGKDSTSGGDGNDDLPQGSAADNGDILSGGAGVDRVNYGSRTSNTRISLDNIANDGADADQNGAAEEVDNVRADVENITTGSGNDFVNANTTAANAAALDNHLDGNSGQDRLDGGRGEDSLYGWNDSDTLIGGLGEDYLYGGDGADKFTANDGDFDRLDAGSGDGDTDTATFDPFDERLYFP